MYPTRAFDFGVEVNAFQSCKTSVQIGAVQSWLRPFKIAGTTQKLEQEKNTIGTPGTWYGGEAWHKSCDDEDPYR